MVLAPDISSMIAEIISTLAEREETLVTAESITAGGLSSAITSIEGSSQVFLGAIVAYRNSVKSEILGIDAALIDTHTVYSQVIAIEMARAVRTRFGSTWSIATTGVAGPGPSDGVPSGSVWVAIDGPVTHNLELSLSGGRESVRNATVATAIGSFARIRRARTSEGG
jgi:nicotinamide-nucleotide amidase